MNNDKIFYILWTDIETNKFNVNHIFADTEDEARELFIEALSILNMDITCIAILFVRELTCDTIISKESLLAINVSESANGYIKKYSNKIIPFHKPRKR